MVISICKQNLTLVPDLQAGVLCFAKGERKVYKSTDPYSSFYQCPFVRGSANNISVPSLAGNCHVKVRFCVFVSLYSLAGVCCTKVSFVKFSSSSGDLI